MFLRVLQICSQESFDEEIAIIRSIEENLCYPDYVIEKCHNFAKKTFYNRGSKAEIYLKNMFWLLCHENFTNLVNTLKELILL